MSERIVDPEPGSMLERAAGLRRRAQGRSQADVSIVVPSMEGGSMSNFCRTFRRGHPMVRRRCREAALRSRQRKAAVRSIS